MEIFEIQPVGGQTITINHNLGKNISTVKVIESNGDGIPCVSGTRIPQVLIQEVTDTKIVLSVHPSYMGEILKVEVQ
jgi:hypothetical protein